MEDAARHTVEVWPFIRPAWNVGSYLTGLFDWKAIAALGTFWAVFVALGRDGKAEQSRLLRERAAVLAFHQQCKNLLQILRSSPDAFPPSTSGKVDAQEAIEQAKILKELKLAPLTLDTLNSVKMTDMSDDRCIIKWSMARAALQHIDDDLDIIIEGGEHSSQPSIDALKSAVDYWGKYSKKLEEVAHPLSSKLKKLKRSTPRPKRSGGPATKKGG